MAIKIQYPGVAKSIDSDVANVVSLLRVSGLVPKSLDLEPLIIEARAQLHLEADYRHEGQQMRDYAAAVLSMDQADSFLLPEWFDELSTEQILCMSFLKGAPLSSIPPGSLEASRVMSELFKLFFAELLCFCRVQTDPNLANFSYQSDTGKIILLDFGAVRTYAEVFVKDYQAALEAAAANDAITLGDALQALGFFKDNINATNRSAVIDIFLMAAEPLRTKGLYDFGASDLASRIQRRGMSISSDPQAWHTPPPDVLFLHRKMAGLYLMAARIAAKVDVGALFAEALQQSPPRLQSDVFAR
jgi:predicted unusual protein kinase regulating ubiquinone biosynthesis (AarF/ABC1/UbiB family)